MDKTPAQVWFNKLPELSRLQIFGSVAYATGHLRKLDDRSQKCIFIGYALNSYRLWDPVKQYYSREIKQEVQTQQMVTTPEMAETRRSERNKKLPEKFKDYVLLTYEEAINGPNKNEWIVAIDEEKKALNDNKTCTAVNREEATKYKILISRWVFRVKDDGKYKARLVIRGCEQKYGINFEEVFSPVVNGSSLRILFALSAKQNMNIIKFDIKSAVLYGNLEEEIYMQRWIKDGKMFIQNKKMERCLFKNKNASMVLAIYVDDGLLIGDNRHEMDTLLSELKAKFEMTINYEPSTFLGTEIVKTTEGIKLTHENYSIKILEKFQINKSKTVTTPLLPCKEQTSDEDAEEANYPYREAVGSLLYLTSKTRPDLAFAVGYANRHLDKPNNQDITNVKRIFKYLNGTISDGIKFKNENNLDLIAYCDADFTGDLDTRKSTTGYVIKFCVGPISWCSRKQDIVALSSTEAEYISVAECCRI